MPRIQVQIEGLGVLEQIEGMHYRIILNPQAVSKLPPEEAARRRAIQEMLENETADLNSQIDEYIKSRDKMLRTVEASFRTSTSSLYAMIGPIGDANLDNNLEILIKEGPKPE